MDDDRNKPDISSKANKAPIKAPFNLKRLDFISKTNKIRIVAFNEETFRKAIVEKGLINILKLFLIYI